TRAVGIDSKNGALAEVATPGCGAIEHVADQPQFAIGLLAIRAAEMFEHSEVCAAGLHRKYGAKAVKSAHRGGAVERIDACHQTAERAGAVAVGAGADAVEDCRRKVLDYGVAGSVGIDAENRAVVVGAAAQSVQGMSEQ